MYACVFLLFLGLPLCSSLGVKTQTHHNVHWHVTVPVDIGHTFTGASQTTSVAVSQDGTRVVVGEDPGKITRFDRGLGSTGLLTNAQENAIPAGRVNWVGFSADTRSYAAGGNTGLAPQQVLTAFDNDAPFTANTANALTCGASGSCGDTLLAAYAVEFDDCAMSEDANEQFIYCVDYAAGKLYVTSRLTLVNGWTTTTIANPTDMRCGKNYNDQRCGTGFYCDVMNWCVNTLADMRHEEYSNCRLQGIAPQTTICNREASPYSAYVMVYACPGCLNVVVTKDGGADDSVYTAGMVGAGDDGEIRIWERDPVHGFLIQRQLVVPGPAGHRIDKPMGLGLSPGNELLYVASSDSTHPGLTVWNRDRLSRRVSFLRGHDFIPLEKITVNRPRNQILIADVASGTPGLVLYDLHPVTGEIDADGRQVLGPLAGISATAFDNTGKESLYIAAGDKLYVVPAVIPEMVSYIGRVWDRPVAPTTEDRVQCSSEDGMMVDCGRQYKCCPNTGTCVCGPTTC